MTPAKNIGIKRHVAVDTQGLTHAIAVTAADVTGRKGALQAFSRDKANLRQVQSVLTDSSYVEQPFAQGVQEIPGSHVTVQVARRTELHTFKGHAQALGRRAQLCLAGEEQAVMEELRAQAQHQLSVLPSRLPGADTQKIVNRLLIRLTPETGNTATLACSWIIQHKPIINNVFVGKTTIQLKIL